MSRRPRPVFEWPLDGQPLTFEVVVRGSSCCRGYTAPPRRGVRTGERWYHGMRLEAVCDCDHCAFVTVLTTEGAYVNVWAKDNRRGERLRGAGQQPAGEAQKGGRPCPKTPAGQPSSVEVEVEAPSPGPDGSNSRPYLVS